MTFDIDAWLALHGLEYAPAEADCEFGWVDIETTGLDPDRDVILEFGFVMTDRWGRVIEDSAFHSLVHDGGDRYTEAMSNMSGFVRNMHVASGLLSDLSRLPKKHTRMVQMQMLTMLREFDLSPREVYWAGNSVHFDVSLLHRDMFDLDEFMHYRQINVSTIKTLAQRLSPDLYDKMLGQLKPLTRHRSMDDLGDSINEFKCYVENFLWI